MGKHLKAIILAAGEGKRLRPLTDTRPKCMVKLFGKELLEYQLGTFQKTGINDITIVTGYRSDIIKFPNVKYYKNYRYNSTNMVESLFCAEKELTGVVIVSYGDIIFEAAVLKKLIETDEDFAIVIDNNWKKYWFMRFKNPLDDLESLRLDEQGYIKEIGQKVDEIDNIHGQYIGLMKFGSKGTEYLKKFYHNVKNSAKENRNYLDHKLAFEKWFMTDFLQGMIDDGHKLKSVKISGGWLEVDTLNDYELYNRMHRDKELDQLIDLKGL